MMPTPQRVASSGSLSDLPQVNLPKFQETTSSIQLAKWGILNGSDIATEVNHTYSKVVKWKKNLFIPPTSKASEDFVEEVKLQDTEVVCLWL